MVIVDINTMSEYFTVVPFDSIPLYTMETACLMSKSGSSGDYLSSHRYQV
jgi:hypothetical protein